MYELQISQFSNADKESYFMNKIRKRINGFQLNSLIYILAPTIILLTFWYTVYYLRL